MLDLNPSTGLPELGAWRTILGERPALAVGAHVERALVQPANEIMQRPGKKFRSELLRLGQLMSLNVSESDVLISRRAFELCAQAIELLHAGSMIVDDVQDGSMVRRGGPTIHRLYGVPGAICAGNWLYFWPLRLIRDADLTPEQERHIIGLYCDAVEKAHYGQALDLAVRVEDVPQGEVPELVAGIAALKTGAVTELAVTMGAVLAGASDLRVEELGKFGHQFGVVLQNLDDLGNLVGERQPEKRYEDLRLGKPSAVWAHAALKLTPSEYISFIAAVRKLQLGNADTFETWLHRSNFVRKMRDEARIDLKSVLSQANTILGCSSHPATTTLKNLEQELLNAYL